MSEIKVTTGRRLVVSMSGKFDQEMVPAEIADELLRRLKTAERWLSSMHSETEDGVETEMRDVHSAAWAAIDIMRAAIARATQERLPS